MATRQVQQQHSRQQQTQQNRHASSNEAATEKKDEEPAASPWLSLFPDRTTCTYTSCYCEENVWQLCKHLMRHDEDGNEPSRKVLDPFYVVFISNNNKAVLLFQQQAGHPPDGHCIWDYHVVLVGKLLGPAKRSLVWDLDTRMDFPTVIDDYFQHAIRPDQAIPRQFRRNFRIVPAAQFFDEFASDRRHMMKPDGTWMSPPPSYEPIKGQNAEDDFNLDKYISMQPSSDNDPNILLDSYQFLTFFSRSC